MADCACVTSTAVVSDTAVAAAAIDTVPFAVGNGQYLCVNCERVHACVCSGSKRGIKRHTEMRYHVGMIN